MRESPTFRTNLEQLNERFAHEELTISEVAAYIRKFNGSLPKNYVTKAQARALGWRGGAY